MASTGEDVEITDDKYIYDSVDDLKNNRGSVLKKLNLQTEQGSYLLLQISSETPGARLSCGPESDDIAAYGKIKAILQDASVPAWKHVLFFALLLALTFAIVVLPLKYLLPLIGQDGAVGVMLICVILTLIPLVIFRPGTATRIFLAERHELTTFWTVKKYDLIWDSLKVIVGFLLGLLTAYLVARARS